MIPEVQLGLVEDPPAAGAAPAPIERPAKRRAETRSRKGVPESRPRRNVQVPIDDLGDAMRGDLHEVFVGGAPFRGCRHPEKLGIAPRGWRPDPDEDGAATS